MAEDTGVQYVTVACPVDQKHRMLLRDESVKRVFSSKGVIVAPLRLSLSFCQSSPDMHAAVARRDALAGWDSSTQEMEVEMRP